MITSFRRRGGLFKVALAVAEIVHARNLISAMLPNLTTEQSRIDLKQVEEVSAHPRER